MSLALLVELLIVPVALHHPVSQICNFAIAAQQVLHRSLVLVDKLVHLLLAVDQGVLKRIIRLICILCSRELVDKLLFEASFSADRHVEALLTRLHDVLFAA